MASPSGLTLRAATATDAPAIRKLIWQVHINPMGLNWRRFWLVCGAQGEMLGCGQVKPHRDGSRELASIAVWPQYRERGVARAVIQHLIEIYPGTLYLTCRAGLDGLYEKFGFEKVRPEEMPPYFRMAWGLVNAWPRLTGRAERLLVMRRG